jgi:hypothetical protein
MLIAMRKCAMRHLAKYGWKRIWHSGSHSAEGDFRNLETEAKVTAVPTG